MNVFFSEPIPTAADYHAYHVIVDQYCANDKLLPADCYF